MNVEAGVEAALRLLGVAYLVGGLYLLRALRVNRAMDAMHDTVAALAAALGDEAPPADPGRTRWLTVGAWLTGLSGAVLLSGARLAVFTQAVLVLHQAAYLSRQALRQRAATTEAAADDARPEASTVNAAIVSVVAWGAVYWARW